MMNDHQHVRPTRRGDVETFTAVDEVRALAAEYVDRTGAIRDIQLNAPARTTASELLAWFAGHHGLDFNELMTQVATLVTTRAMNTTQAVNEVIARHTPEVPLALLAPTVKAAPPMKPPKPVNRDAIAKQHEKTKRARRVRVAASRARRRKR